MAYNLIKHGHHLVVYDISQDAVEKLRDRSKSFDGHTQVETVKHPYVLCSALLLLYMHIT